ncbi:IclR family transcriptional regulator domain-containing protein [Rathayibacter sp. YIM 133350]|uniref:IclR family transcriptional regulator domain-containing protein n=1 Tax=Rathayibacter sp. YIM 133350 TaxID=3131992 RepID=UPI003FD609E4
MVARVVLTLDCCLESSDPVSLAALSAATGLPKSTVWRIAENLTSKGLLARTAAGYQGGVGLVARGDQAARQWSLRANTVPELVELHKLSGAAVWAVDVRNFPDWTVVGSIYDTSAVRNRYSDDWRHDPTDASIMASALGHVGLADHPDRVENLLRRGIPRLTPNTETNPQRVLTILHRARQDRELIEHGGVWRGWSCIAVPITDHRHATVGVLGVVDRTTRFAPKRLSLLAHASAGRLRGQWSRSGT